MYRGSETQRQVTEHLNRNVYTLLYANVLLKQQLLKTSTWGVCLKYLLEKNTINKLYMYDQSINGLFKTAIGPFIGGLNFQI